MLELCAKSQNQHQSPFLLSHAESLSAEEVPGETESGTRGGGGSGASRHPAPGGPGYPTGLSGTDTSPSPVTTVSVSPRAAGAAGLTLGTGTGDLGGRTKTRPRWTLSQTHTPGTEQRTEARSVSLPGRSYFATYPTPVAPTPTCSL